MRDLWAEIWEFVVDLWDTGNWWVRAAIVFVFVPPLVALLFALGGFNAVATAMALTPLLALVFVPLAIIDPLVIVAVAGALGFHPTAANFRQWLARWVPLYIGSVLAYGVYLFFVPVANNPVLVLPLIGAVGAVTLFVASGARGTVVRWTTRILAIIAIGITVVFFFSGKKEAEAQAAEQVAATQAVARVEEFSFNKGEEKSTVLVGPGSWYRIQANRAWVAICAQPGENFDTCQMPAGYSTWQVRREETREGLLLVKGLEDGTTLRFERVR